MLPNYDAKAVAEVLGLAFVRAPKEGKGERVTSVSSKIDDEFVIGVDEAGVHIVEMKKNSASKASAARLSQFNSLASSPSPVLIEKAVESGLPAQIPPTRCASDRRRRQDEGLSPRAERGPQATLERRESKLSPQESERTERIARLFVHARRALGTEAEAREFMTTPHPELDRRSPIEAAKTDLGTRRAEQILNALEYGLAIDDICPFGSGAS